MLLSLLKSEYVLKRFILKEEELVIEKDYILLGTTCIREVQRVFVTKRIWVWKHLGNCPVLSSAGEAGVQKLRVDLVFSLFLI